MSTPGRRWTLEQPGLGTGPVPVEPCTSPEFFAKERDKIFGHVWLNVGREEEIPEPGDYFVRELAVCNTSILVARGSDGVIRAFHNVCSHRGNRVVCNERGRTRGFVCRFHGWAFGLDGALHNVPEEEKFFSLKKEDLGLVPVSFDSWEGFLFVCLDPNPKESLREFLGEMANNLSGYPFSKLTKRYVHKAEVRANWKVILDAFQEGYHFRYQHARSLADVFMPKDVESGFNLFRVYDRHRMVSANGNLEHIPTPLELLAFGHGGFLSPEIFPLDSMPEGVNPTKSPNWATDINVFFPNFVIQLAANGVYFTWNLWPLGVDRTLWEARMYAPPPKNLAQRFCQEYIRTSGRDTILEDMYTLENVQAGLGSGVRKHFVLQDGEILVRHFHKVVADAIQADVSGR